MSDKIRWAPKVSQTKIRRLYESDAQGVIDPELIEEVGIALYARCQSILWVSSAQVRCPRCGLVFPVNRGQSEDTPLPCPAAGCSWQTTFRQWHSSWRHQDLIGTKAAPAFEGFIAQYEHAQRPQEKMILIDRLIHAFHWGIIAETPHRLAANNLIEGSYQQVIAFLDRLTYGEKGTPGLAEKQTEWREQVIQTYRVRRSQTP